MKKSLLACVFAFCGIHLYAQQSYNTNNLVAPHQADVASLLKFSEVPVSYFNGKAQISVPLYDIRSGDLSYPITISYNSSGVKAAEEAGLVGLGWNISTIAAIVETNPIGAQSGNIHPAIAPDGFAMLPPNVPSSAFNLVMSGELFKDIYGNCKTYPPFNPGYPSFEPDPFVMSVNGTTAKFFIPNGENYVDKWICVDGQNIKLNGSALTSFQATLSDGTKYIFAHEHIAVTQTPVTSLTEIPYFSYSCYLSQIISPTGKTITFKYLAKFNVPQTQSQQGLSETWAVDDAPTDAKFKSGATITPSSYSENMYVDEIDYDNGYAKFSYSTRADMAGYKLDNIKIFKNNEQAAIKTIAFQYDYFAYGGGNFGDYITDAQFVGPSLMNGPPLAYRQNRLKLLAVQINNDPPYRFDYDPTPLPYKTSFAQDMWGYFNGNTIKTLLPDYNKLGYLDQQVPISLMGASAFTFADRAAHFNFTKAGILNRIVYPTSGYTVFQYESNAFNLEASNTTITDSLIAVTDISTGVQQQEFDIPDVNLTGSGIYTGVHVNPTSVSVQLICGGGNGGCSVGQGYSGGCSGYAPSNLSLGLYALLEKFDPGSGTWSASQNNIFDFTNADLNNTSPCGASNLSRELLPGHYRITANYPDNMPGAYGGASAFISIRYKITKVLKYPNTGGGLRVSQITDYSAGGQIASQRKFTYSTGKMMTKPIFYRYMSGSRQGGPSSSCPRDINNEWNIDKVEGACISQNATSVQSNRNFLVLYNNPILPFSYSANGSPVGYDTVSVQKLAANGQDAGRSVYRYNCKPDSYLFYGTNLPGIPSTPFLDNGTLLEEQEQKKVAPDTYVTLRSTNYNYIIGSAQTFWAYKFEYMPRYNIDGSPEYMCVDPFSQFLHFYPIKTGHVNLVNKVEKVFDSSNPVVTTTNYIFNEQNQQRSSTTVKSNGDLASTETYYPGDYSTSGDFLSAMRTYNMLDYPIENIFKINGKAVSAIYKEYAFHDAMVTPSKVYTLKTDAPVTFTASVPNNILDPHYEPRVTYTYDSYGNQTKMQENTGPVTNYLWDHNYSLQVATIRNAAEGDFAYTSFEADNKGNWTYAGTPLADASTPKGKYSYDMSTGAVTAIGLSAAHVYILCYWTKNTTPFTVAGTMGNYPVALRTFNGWTNYVHRITGITTISLTGTGLIDDLELLPADAQMTTYIHNPLIGLLSSTDARGNTFYYDYDQNQRLSDIKDLDGHIIKHYQYRFAGWNTDGFHATFTNTVQSQILTKNDCTQGAIGSQLTYTVPAGQYLSFVSQADADAQAQDDINLNGQKYVNSIGGCVIPPCLAPQLSITNTGGTGYSLTYTGTGSATAIFLSITDTSTGSSIGQPPNVSPAGGTITGNVPATGKTYTFKIMAFGSNCPGGVSGQVNSSF